MYFVTAIKLVKNCENIKEMLKEQQWLKGIDPVGFYNTVEEAKSIVSGKGPNPYFSNGYEYVAIEKIEPGFMPLHELVGIWKVIFDKDGEITGYQEVKLGFVDEAALGFALTQWED